MKKVYPLNPLQGRKGIVLILLFLCFSVKGALAQHYKVYIKIGNVSVKGFSAEGRYGHGPRYRFQDRTGRNLLAGKECVQKFGSDGSWNTHEMLLPVTVDAATHTFDLVFLSHDEIMDGSDPCTPQMSANRAAGTSDSNQGRTVKKFDLRDYTPGAFSEPITLVNQINDTVYASCQIQLLYQLSAMSSTGPPPVTQKTPKPWPTWASALNPPQITGTNNSIGNFCADQQVTISTSPDPHFAGDTAITYQWMYNVPGYWTWGYLPYQDDCIKDCNNLYIDEYSSDTICEANCYKQYPTSDVWRPYYTLLATTNSPTYSFKPVDAINISHNTTLNFAVILLQNGKQVTDTSSNNSYTFSPAAPNIGAATLTTTPSCPGGNGTGVISVSNVTGYTGGSYRYILRNGYNNTDDCDPDQNQSCFNIAASGYFTGSSFQINTVNAGAYTLWVTNAGGQEGVCAATTNVTVDAVAPLALLVSAVTPVSCPGANDGSVTLSHTGGTADNIIYQLIQNNAVIASNSSGSFTGLPPGSYTVSVTDGCGQNNANTYQTISITAPTQVTGSTTIAQPTCNGPANGWIKVNVSGGSGSYTYTLSNGGTVVTQVNASNSNNWLFTQLPAGQYQLAVVDAQLTSCAGFTQTITLNAPADLTFPVSGIQVTNITCYGDSTGSINALGAQGGDQTGQFQYLLSMNTQLLQQNTTGIFQNLPAGAYTLSRMRTLPGCQDIYNVPVLITQPRQMTVSFQQADVTCFGRNDGWIIARVQGGSGSYDLSWQLLLNGQWSSLPQTGDSLIGLGPGNYRLQVQDSQVLTCVVISDTVTIHEPALLQIDSVKVHDIVCISEPGTLEPVVTGGNLPYTLQYSTDRGATYHTFTSSTPLDPGTYQVKVTDAKGCTDTYAGLLTLTEPPAALTFGYTLSSYNGYQVSCQGGTNGTVTVTASGGNGSKYQGYSYAVDSSTFQISNVLQGLGAGQHTIRVTDARGCIATQTVNLTQPPSLIALSLAGKTDVVCYGDYSGALTLNATGGLAPYQYSIDGGNTWQNSSEFTGQTAGAYNTAARDINGCTAYLSVTILALHPPIVVNAQITNVSCYGGSDGGIVVDAAGGGAPYRYHWVELNSDSDSVGTLQAGNYRLIVTDGMGCIRDTMFTVAQPDHALGIQLQLIPVCADRTDGSITIAAEGGTAPYQYSIDNGASFGSTPVFTVGVGSYPVVVQDAKGCQAGIVADIIQRNDLPQPNFLVATTDETSDTLVVKEISIPKPDSVQWVFDPHAQVLDSNQWAPMLRFAQPGTYTLSMTGYFAACAYSISQTLTLAPYDSASHIANLAVRSLTSLTVAPSPNDGNFTVQVAMSREQSLSVTIFDVLGNVYYQGAWTNTTGINQALSLDKAPSGLYLIRAVTDDDAQELRFVVNK